MSHGTDIKVDIDLDQKSFEEFWRRTNKTLFYQSADEAVRISQWKKLIKKDFNEDIDAVSFGADATKNPWVKKFRSYSKNVPMWHQ